MLTVHVSSPDTNEAIIQRFQADRSREYDEFAERCIALLAEISKETEAGKYTFAEMEETEHDIEKREPLIRGKRTKSGVPYTATRRCARERAGTPHFES